MKEIKEYVVIGYLLSKQESATSQIQSTAFSEILSAAPFDPRFTGLKCILQMAITALGLVILFVLDIFV